MAKARHITNVNLVQFMYFLFLAEIREQKSLNHGDAYAFVINQKDGLICKHIVPEIQNKYTVYLVYGVDNIVTKYLVLDFKLH